jgi:hypothetical protein
VLRIVTLHLLPHLHTRLWSAMAILSDVRPHALGEDEHIINGSASDVQRVPLIRGGTAAASQAQLAAGPGAATVWQAQAQEAVLIVGTVIIHRAFGLVDMRMCTRTQIMTVYVRYVTSLASAHM